MLKVKAIFGKHTMLVCFMLSFVFNAVLESYAVPLSYGITVCTEAEQLNRLMNQLSSNLEDDDAIFLQVDSSNTNDEVQKVIEKFKKIIPSSKFYITSIPLNKDFGTFKNHLLDTARQQGVKHIFLIDADEYLSDFLVKNIKWFIANNLDVDVIKVPRANYYVGDVSECVNLKECLEKESDFLGRWRYPDEQPRILDLTNTNIKFVNKVHEAIVGYTKSLTLPYEGKGNHWDIIHIKSPKEQNKAGQFYATLAPENNKLHTTMTSAQKTVSFDAVDLPTQVGIRQSEDPFLVSEKDKAGFLSFGPYIALPKGTYKATIHFSSTNNLKEDVGYWDICADYGKCRLITKNIVNTAGSPSAIETIFKVTPELEGSKFEIRTFSNGKGQLTLKSIVLERM